MNTKLHKKIETVTKRLLEIDIDLMYDRLSYKTQQYLMNKQRGLEIDRLNLSIALAAENVAEKRKKRI